MILPGHWCGQLFDLPDLRACLVDLLNQIPRGRVATYGSLARALGDVRASRWIGSHLLHHDHDEDCRCHRVVRVDGSLGNYILGADRKQARLAEESVGTVGGRVRLAEYAFHDWMSSSPLSRLRGLQHQIADQVDIHSPRDPVTSIGGIDVSYVPQRNEAVATYVELATGETQPRWQRSVRRPVLFPYISSYLAFRELPLLVELLQEVTDERGVADVVMVDGSGVLHPRQAGIATMLGVILNVPTIGITKKRLVGTVASENEPERAWRAIEWQSEVRGAVICPRHTSRRPIYVSPGHLIDPLRSIEVTARCLLGRRLPEPIYWADRLSRQQARG